MLCVYRQWKLPPELDPSRKSNNLPDQLSRLDQLLAPLDSLAAEGKLVAVAGGLNIDHLVTNDPRGRYDLKKLHERLDLSKDESSLEQLNFKPTRYRINTNPSLLDLFLTNTPAKFNCIETRPSAVADHWIVKAQMHVQDLEENIQFMKVRNWKMITSERLMEKIKDNEELNAVFKYRDPDKIAETMVLELNNILEEVSPSRVVEKKTYRKYTHAASFV